MYEGYLNFGGNEIVNSSRTVGYTTSSTCGVSWLQCEPCDGIPNALGETLAYTYANIADAPWYDKEDPATHRFLGVSGLTVEGMTDSTRTAEVTEGITDGGTVGRPRSGTRRVRVEAVLSAQGEDALEAGLAWLNAALIPRNCSVHGASCGSADVQFFTACPPARSEITAPSVVWNDPVTNRATNPSMEKSIGTPGNSGTVGRTFTQPSGSAGALEIRHVGPSVELWIRCTDPVMTVSNLAWTATINGGAVNGVVNLAPGFGARQVGVWSLDATPSQVVSFTIANSGTSSLGGPTTVTATLALATPASGGVTVRTNLATNPSFEATTAATVEVRRNLCVNPNFEANVTGWSATSATQAVSTAQAHSGAQSNLVTCATASPASGDIRLTGGSASAFPAGVVAGGTYTVSAWINLAAPLDGLVTNSSSRQLRILYFYSTDGATSTPLPGPQGANVTGWQRISHTFTVPANATGVIIGVGCSGSATDPSVVTYVDDVLLEQSPFLGPYFDGSTLPAGDFTHAWTGTANASASVQYGIQTITPLTSAAWSNDSTSFNIQSTEWAASGARSARSIPRNSGAYQYLLLTNHAAFTVGKTYTVMVTMRMKETQTHPTPSPYARSLVYKEGSTYYSQAQAPNAPGVYPLRITFTYNNVSPALIMLYGQSYSVGTVADSKDVWWDDFLIVEGTYTGPYFDGSTPAAGDFSYAWSGTANASTSVQSAPGVAGVTGGFQSTEWAVDRTHSLAVVSGKTATIAVPAGSTVVLTARAVGQLVNGVAISDTAVRLTGFGGTLTLGEGWWDGLAIVAGDYAGPYFDGSFSDSTETELVTVGTQVHQYDWTGTADASSSTLKTGSVISMEDPVGYQAALDALTRYMHTSTAVSGPTIVQQFHRGDAWGYVVEFVLVSAVPWTFGPTKSVPGASNPSVPVVIQDTPFNLVPYPSAEIALGSVIAATNYSDNPSVELGLTNWGKGSNGAVVLADVVQSQSSKAAGGLASVGDKSARERLTASNTSATAGSIRADNTSATFPTAVAGTRMSVNMWTSAQVVSGTAVLSNIEVYAVWRNGTTQMTADLVGTITPAGGAVSKKSMLVPVGATNVIVRAQANLASWSAGAVVDLYADAIAITVP